ncbi:ATP/GTP-binding protein [Streptomyces sp. NBC_01276]|uniref:ATP/GTP-binding protein n=1 Tax=Streptomyces sp. NBC_01276 TaxID=2903808 RepID=UPI00352CA3A7
MLSRAAAAALLLAGVLAPAAQAADGPGGGVCRGATMFVKVCAQDGSSRPGAGGARPAGTSGGGGDSGPSCTYTRLVPQPPPDNSAWQGHQYTGEKGAVYGVNCPDRQGAYMVWIADGQEPAAPRIDPETLARQAADSMKLAGPAVASPRAAGTYVVGMPMWMWVDPSPTTFGPNTASATAGGVTVTATAKVSSIAWNMGDGTTVTCTGPGTRYDASMGKAFSPDCGHRYTRPSSTSGGKYAGTATATWTVRWQAPALGDAGSFTEARQTPFTVDVHEVQVLN